MLVNQKDGVNLHFTKKTVKWLIDNTEVSVFDPIKFTGYQRKIDEGHCEKLISYIESNGFYLPTAIICATSEEFDESKRLRIVDGQHRVHAFDVIKNTKKDLFDIIQNLEVPVIVLENTSGDEKIEIDTFISINKTSKKVDTSLAFVLKNKLNAEKSSEDLSISRREYLSVEIAHALNNPEKYDMWDNLILFEGVVKASLQTISLNAFVKSTRTFLANLEKKGAIQTTWNTAKEIDDSVNRMSELLDEIWSMVKSKWPGLFKGNIDDRRIIQGAIGYSSINRYFNYRMKEDVNKYSFPELKKLFKEWIDDMDISEEKWKANSGDFSNYSSEAGYTIVAKELLKSAGIDLDNNI